MDLKGVRGLEENPRISLNFLTFQGARYGTSGPPSMTEPQMNHRNGAIWAGWWPT